MILYKSTSGKIFKKTFQEAVFDGFAPDGSLYLPETFPILSEKKQSTFRDKTFPECAFLLLRELLSNDLIEEDLEEIVHAAFTFPLPLISLDGNKTFLLELFHGPTLSFKDIGSRFLAELLAKWIKKQKHSLTVIVATSGDTGSAVGRAFYKKEGVRVVILFPKDKISDLQKKQLTTMGENIISCEVEGTFDECQYLAKAVLEDHAFRKTHPLTIGNSINIARIFGQMLYFFYACAQLPSSGKKPLLSIPSGNFGHLVSGLFAKKMGLQVERFLGATNINDEIPLFLETGEFVPRPSLETIASAMDVGNPSNFGRLIALYNHDLAALRRDVEGMSFTDDQIREEIKKIYLTYDYLLDPHTAIGSLALEEYQKRVYPDNPKLLFATAHPAKFKDRLEPFLGVNIEVPDRLEKAISQRKFYHSLPPKLSALKELIIIHH